MPIYEYLCQQCDHHLEALQKLSDEPLVFCPECGEAALRKQVSAAAFRLKGTGWYETDFKNAGKEKDKPKNAKDDAGKTAKILPLRSHLPRSLPIHLHHPGNPALGRVLLLPPPTQPDRVCSRQLWHQ